MLPKTNLEITSFVSEDIITLQNMKAISVPTVLAERTFWEKATILHAEYFRKTNSPDRYARHYYDLHQLGQSWVKERAYESAQLLSDVVKFKEKFYPLNRAHYDLATTRTILLRPAPDKIQSLNEDYQKMSQMIYGEKISFDKILAGLAQLETEIHNL